MSRPDQRWDTTGVIYLLIIYAKGVKDSIPAKTLNAIRETING